jgi:hypothetical protein
MLIAYDNVSEAVKRSMDFIKDFGNNKDDINAILLISNKYHRIKRSIMNNTDDDDDLDVQMNKVLLGMLELLDQIEDNFLLFNGQTAQN